MNKEIWKPVLGYEGQYEVSSMGRVRSFIAKSPMKILACYVRKDGYVQVQLKVNQQKKNKLVHVLMDEAFNGPRVHGFVVNHMNGRKSDNRLENLERITFTANIQHAFATGLCGTRKGERNSQALLNEEIVAEIKKVYANNLRNGRIKLGMAQQLAKKYGVAVSTISGIGRSVSWKHTAAHLGVEFA